MSQLTNKHLLVVGGTEGIGLAVVQEAVRRRAQVSVVARRPERLVEVCETLNAGPTAGPVLWRQGDACDLEALQVAVDELVTERATPFDVVVTTVGGALPGRFLDVPVEEFHSQMDLNFFSAVNVAKATLPMMVEREAGHLAFTGSTAGLLGVFGYTGYGASKWALRGLAETLRYEVERYGVQISVSYPPDTYTPGFDAENLRKPPETAAIAASIKPMAADDVAQAILNGIESGRGSITADYQSRLLAFDANPLSRFARRLMRRQITKVPSTGRMFSDEPSFDRSSSN